MYLYPSRSDPVKRQDVASISFWNACGRELLSIVTENLANQIEEMTRLAAARLSVPSPAAGGTGWVSATKLLGWQDVPSPNGAEDSNWI